MSKAEIYTKNGCNYCVQAKALLRMMEVEFEEYNFQIDEARKTELFERALAINVVPKTAPQIWIDGKYIGGYDQLKAYYDAQH